MATLNQPSRAPQNISSSPRTLSLALPHALLLRTRRVTLAVYWTEMPRASLLNCGRCSSWSLWRKKLSDCGTRWMFSDRWRQACPRQRKTSRGERKMTELRVAPVQLHNHFQGKVPGIWVGTTCVAVIYKVKVERFILFFWG